MTTTTTTTTVILLTSAHAGLALGIVATILLIMALIIRELTTAYAGYHIKPPVRERLRLMLHRERVKALSKNVLVAIVPLLLIFILVVVTEVSDILTT